MAERMEQVIAQAWGEEKPQLWWQGEWLSSRWLMERAGALEEALRQRGFGVGHRLATLLPVCPAFHALSLACWRLGGAVVPLNGAVGATALEPVLRSADPSLVVICPELASHRANFQDFHQPLAAITPLGEMGDFSLRDAQPDEQGDRWAVIFFTSGTTGQPKGVPLTHHNLLSNIRAAHVHALDAAQDQTLLNVLPNFHALGCVVSGWLPLVLGYRQAMVPSFLPVSTVIETIQSAEATLAVMVPTMLHFFVGTLAKSKAQVPSLKLMVCGGDRLSKELEERARHLLGIRLLEGYGLTEASPVLAVTSNGKEHPTGTVGTFLPGVEYRLEAHEGADGQSNVGELWVRGPSIATEYFRAPEATALQFRDGWLDTGDLVRVDDDGTVTILERVSDLIIVGGFNVYPQEVEAVLMNHKAVKQAGVVGCAQSVSGEMIRGFVVLADGVQATPAELVEWCRQRLPHYKVPRRIEILSELPVNALGKVLRRKLRDLC